jgi:hypothetical protein
VTARAQPGRRNALTRPFADAAGCRASTVTAVQAAPPDWCTIVWWLC